MAEEDNNTDLIVEWDVEIPMDDGIVLRADVFRPKAEGQYPVIMSMGPYSKGLHFKEGYKGNWNRLVAAYPEVEQGSTGRYQNWEVVDPEKWVPDGYVCIRVDSRGAGRSPGFLDPFSPRETKDFHDCIEWAATLPYSNGRIGLSGISYYAINQAHVAGLKPPHLTAICVWEGAGDFYREMSRNGGILSQFQAGWFDRQVVRVQYGVGERGFRNPITGVPVAGDVELPEEELVANRVNLGKDLQDHVYDDDYYRARSANYADITVPMLSAGNWGGQGLHLRGNLALFNEASSPEKWLEMHGDTHFSHYYSDYGVTLQKEFFAYYLKQEDNGWADRPAVTLNVRHPGEKFVLRHEAAWPIPRTQWTKVYLDPATKSLVDSPQSGEPVSYEALGEGIRFETAPFDKDVEITGPSAAHLVLSSDTTDADVFLTLQVFDPEGNEVRFIGTNDPSVPVGNGWLRASARELDPVKSLPYRPYHPHTSSDPLVPGEPVALDIEIWPTSIVIPAGYTLALWIRGKDYKHEDVYLPDAMYPTSGVGPFLHSDPGDRPESIFGGTNTLHFYPDDAPYILLPIIPEEEA